MDDLKKSFISACCLTIATFCILLVNIQSDSDTSGIISIVCMLVLVVATISQWVKYWKLFIDFRIEEKLQQFKQSKEDVCE